MKAKFSAQQIFLVIVLIIDIISLIPSPVIFMASMMSAADGNVNYKDFFELLIRFLWLLSAFYPVYIILPYAFGRDLLVRENNKIGYFLCILSLILALFVICLILFIFIR